MHYQLAMATAFACKKIIWVMENDGYFDKLLKYASMVGIAMILTLLTGIFTTTFFNGIPSLCEEVMKAVFAFISTKFAIVFTLVFSIIEMIGYLVKYGEIMELKTGSEWTYPIVRLWCVIDHCLYMAIHIYGNYKGRKSGVWWKHFLWIFGAFNLALILHWLHNNVIGPYVAEAIMIF